MRELKGNSQIRGRNGWFVPRQMQAWVGTQAPMTETNQKEVVVEIYSKQVGSYAPVWMWLSVEDAKLLVGEITSAIVDAENPAEVAL